jgi:hypothetical protein
MSLRLLSLQALSELTLRPAQARAQHSRIGALITDGCLSSISGLPR